MHTKGLRVIEVSINIAFIIYMYLDIMIFHGVFYHLSLSPYINLAASSATTLNESWYLTKQFWKA